MASKLDPRTKSTRPPSMSRVKRVRLPTGKLIDWKRIRSDYAQQVSGQGYSSPQMRSDLKKKREAFTQLAQAVWYRDNGYSDYAIGKTLGVSRKTVANWLDNGLMPRVISYRRHEHYQRKRNRVRLNPAQAPHEYGYFLALPAVGAVQVARNALTGKSRYIISANNEGVKSEVQRSLQHVFGLRPRTSRYSVILDSTELARRAGGIIADPDAAFNSLPNSPKARLGWTRGIFDRQRGIWVQVTDKHKRVLLRNDDPRILDRVAQTLSEQGIAHERGNFMGGDGISITSPGITAFKRAIGFRDPKRQNKLPG